MAQQHECQHEVHFALQEGFNKETTRLLEKLAAFCFGNGKSGADSRIEDHEKQLAFIRKVAWLLVVSVVGNVAATLFFLIREVLRSSLLN
ncbi:MAG: hypothetical protein ACOCVL_04140 [Candidatus Sumerlaeota bacterium]